MIIDTLDSMVVLLIEKLLLIFITKGEKEVKITALFMCSTPRPQSIIINKKLFYTYLYT